MVIAGKRLEKTCKFQRRKKPKKKKNQNKSITKSGKIIASKHPKLIQLSS